MPSQRNRITPADAERLAELMLRMTGFRFVRRAVRTRWHAVDFFGADMVGKHSDGTTAYVQVTTGGIEAQRRRKRKLEGVPWGAAELVCLAVATRRDGKAALECERYVRGCEWERLGLWVAPPKWRDVLRKLRKEARNEQGTDDHPVTD